MNFMSMTSAPSARRVFLDPPSQHPDQQAAVERAFFRSICLPNGSHKTTAAGRLNDVDVFLAALLRPRQDVRLLDVGISSGVTTAELIDHLHANGHRVEAVGMDLRVHARLRRCFGVDVLFDEAGRVLQLATARLAKGRPDPSSRSAKAGLLRGTIAAVECLCTRRWARQSRNWVRISLVTPRLLRRPGFELIEHDLAQPVPLSVGRFDVIRAANLLNFAYFPPSLLRTMLGNLLPALKHDGLLVVCRTAEPGGANDATAFRFDEPTRSLVAV